MEDIMARLIYSLEMSINQGKQSDWEEQPASVKNEWRKDASAVYRFTR